VTLLVIVLNYRVTGLAIECLRSLAREIPCISGARAVMVENGSGGDAAALLHDAIFSNGWAPWAELRVLPENLGFTGGNNLVIREAMASDDPPQRVLLLNADTVIHDGAIQALIESLDQHPRAGIAGSRLVYPDGRPQGTPFRFQGIASEFERGAGIGLVSSLLRRWAVCPPKPAVAVPVDWVAGACMMIRREVIETLGTLDDDYFAYFEDMDYCLNARRAGWETWYVPESWIVHHEGQSSGIEASPGGARPAYWFQARRRYFLKNHGAAYAALADAAFLIGRAIGKLARRLAGKPDPAPRGFFKDSIRHSVFVSGFRLRRFERQ
jgi:hypothetical protein